MMDTVQGFLLAVGWFVLRFGLPILVTLLVIRFLKQLDTRWQSEAEDYRRKAGVESLVPVVRCWLLNDCPPERMEKCPAYLDQKVPCWQHFRARDGQLKENCLGCDAFRAAPVPALGD